VYPVIREFATDGIPVSVSCRILQVARQPYCRWLKQPVGPVEVRRRQLTDAIREAHTDDPEFGYRFLADEVRAGGHGVFDRTVWRICSENGWWASFTKRKRRTKTGLSVAAAHDDLVRRAFTATGPNRVWLTDITEHRTDEGKLYVCAVKDLWSKRIIGYAIDDRMKAHLAVAAVETAVARRSVDVAGCIVHSDRGSQFRSRKMKRCLDRHGLVGSMGQVGTAADNAAMESFFSLLQNNVLDRQRWKTRNELRIAIVTWIERTYHRRRRQQGLGRLTPIEYETITTPDAARKAA
jgi:transposase InsO family protein